MSKFSILPPEMRGVMYITGRRGHGKSWLASQADLPQNIAYLDFEKKGEGINSQLGFGLYRSMTEDENASPQTVYRNFQKTLSEIEPGQYNVCVLDNISPLELALKAEVRNSIKHYCTIYALNETNVLAGRFGGLSSVVNFLISDKVCNPLFAKGISLIIAIAHVGAKWGTGGPIPGKLNGKGGDRWQELSILSLIVIPGDNPPIPSAIVQKEQLGTISLSGEMTQERIDAIMRGEEGHTTSRRLPARLPEATFQKIRWYLSHPADIKNPVEGETPTEDEIEPFSDRLSKEQYEIMRLSLEKEKRDIEQEKTIALAEKEQDPTRKEALRLKADGKSMPEILAALKEELEPDLTLPELVKILK